MSEIFDLLAVQRDVQTSAFDEGYKKGKGIEKAKVEKWAEELKTAIKGDEGQIVTDVVIIVNEMEEAIK